VEGRAVVATASADSLPDPETDHGQTALDLIGAIDRFRGSNR
jgi:hypothetical protein